MGHFPPDSLCKAVAGFSLNLAASETRCRALQATLGRVEMKRTLQIVGVVVFLMLVALGLLLAVISIGFSKSGFGSG